MTETLILGVPIVAVTPGLVEVLKHVGLPPRFAGAAAIVCAALLAALADVAGLASPASGVRPEARVAVWVLSGVVYGLAAAGLYTQGKALAAANGNSARVP
jgi:hypothetical protein